MLAAILVALLGASCVSSGDASSASTTLLELPAPSLSPIQKDSKAWKCVTDKAGSDALNEAVEGDTKKLSNDEADRLIRTAGACVFDAAGLSGRKFDCTTKAWGKAIESGANPQQIIEVLTSSTLTAAWSQFAKAWSEGLDEYCGDDADAVVSILSSSF